ncbi:MAG TPA: DNA polymerase III subunit delta [Candidatus Hydrogenedentes bacterium]|nr:DNA polymerase III subunit delta [Candidatus Hydrogenedentota bacterium]
MGIPVQDFIRTIGKTPPPRIILFTAGKPPWGKEAFEPYLADEAVEKMIEHYVEKSLRDLALTIAYADETAPGQVAEQAQTLPFLVEQQVILVRNGNVYMNMPGEKKSPVTPLLDCLEAPPESTILMMVASTADKRKRLYKAFENNGAVVECPQLDDTRLALWIRERVSERNLSITQDAITALIDRAGSRLSDVMNALNLVCNFASGKPSVSKQDVLDACADVAEATVWALTDAIASSNPTAALEALHELLAMNKHPNEIMGTINWLLESAYRAHPQTQAAIGKRFVAEKVAPLARKFNVKRLVDALALCTRTHFALRTTGTNEQLLLELLIIKLAVARK